MGFLGASPFHNTYANWAGAVAGLGAVYVWTRWLGHASACNVATGLTRDDLVERPSAFDEISNVKTLTPPNSD